MPRLKKKVLSHSLVRSFVASCERVQVLKIRVRRILKMSNILNLNNYNASLQASAAPLVVHRRSTDFHQPDLIHGF